MCLVSEYTMFAAFLSASASHCLLARVALLARLLALLLLPPPLARAHPPSLQAAGHGIADFRAMYRGNRSLSPPARTNASQAPR
jgi:hypothetical protein